MEAADRHIILHLKKSAEHIFFLLAAYRLLSFCEETIERIHKALPDIYWFKAINKDARKGAQKIKEEQQRITESVLTI